MAARKVNLPLDRFAIHTALYFIGSVILHSAVCIWDDMVDVKFDRQVGTWLLSDFQKPSSLKWYM